MRRGREKFPSGNLFVTESLPHRQKGFCKCELFASLRSAANLYGIFGEKETDLSIRAKEIF